MLTLFGYNSLSTTMFDTDATLLSEFFGFRITSLLYFGTMSDTDTTLHIDVGTRRIAALGLRYFGTMGDTDPTHHRDVGTHRITAFFSFYFGTSDTDTTLHRDVCTRRIAAFFIFYFDTMLGTDTTSLSEAVAFGLTALLSFGTM